MGDNKKLINLHEQKFNELENFKSNIHMFQANTGASLKNIETQVGQLAMNMENQNKGTFPSDTQKNPKDCMAIQLRSGKEVSSNSRKEKKEKTDEEEEETGRGEEKNMSEKTTDAEKQKLTEQPEKSFKLELKANVQAYTSVMPFPQRLQKARREEQFSKFLEIFRKIEINIPSIEAINQMLNYAKFLKKILIKKKKIAEEGIVNLIATCSAVIQRSLPAKMKDPGSFTIPCSIGKYEFKKALCDSSASINLMPLSVVHRLNLGELLPTTITLQMADRSMVRSEGVLKDVLFKVRKFIFPVDFVIMKMEEDTQVPILIGRPFLATGAALIDVQKGELTLRVGDEAVHFNLNKSLEQPDVDAEICMAVENSSPISVELNSDCNLHHSINETEMNFQYLDNIDYELLPSSWQNIDSVLYLFFILFYLFIIFFMIVCNI